MESKWKLKQSTISVIILAIFFLIVVMLGWSISYMNSSIKAEQNAEKRRTEFKQLGINLADASDYLTDEARKFAVTRQISHLKKYWEEINVTRTRDNVISRLQELESPKEELELLAEAKKHSDALVETERRSMRLALEGMGEKEENMVFEIASYVLSGDDKALNKSEKLSKAIQIMNDAPYDIDKKNIMDPIDKFQKIMNKRLESELELARNGTKRATVLQVVLAFIIIFSIAILIRILFTQVTFPIRNYTLMLKDFSVEKESFSLASQGTLELRMLAENFNELYKTLKTARDEADHANKAKSEFLANMSHEIRTPLNSIIGYQYLIKTSGLSPKQNEYSESIGLAAKNLLEIINEILDFSKIEAGRMVLEDMDFDIVEMLEELVIIMGMEAKRKGIDIEYKVNDKMPKFLRGDVTRLKQVVMNLLSNAIKFTQQGRVVICVELLETDGSKVAVKFSVSDTGIGISDEQKKLLFQVFTQGDASTSRKYGGTGLGLAICKRIVELMEGEISVESQIGKGSTFSFSVVLKLTDSIILSKKGISQVTPFELLKNKKILLVEDSAVNLQMTKEILENMGITTDTAESGPQAIRMLKSNKYEAVLMDIRMPGMDGYEATRQIRKIEGKYVPIIALTADAVEEVSQKAKEAGMDVYLTKPLEPSKLLEALAGIMNFGDEYNFDYKHFLEKPSIQTSLNEFNSPPVDYEGSIKRIGGKKDNYIQILKRYVKIHKDDSQKIKEYILSGNKESLKEFLHSLKGSCANIGALKLKDLIIEIDSKLDFICQCNFQEAINNFELEFERVNKWSNNYIQSYDSSQTNPEIKNQQYMRKISQTKIIEDMKTLHKLLSSGDSIAKSFFVEKLGYLDKVLKKETYNGLKEKISTYSFQEAANIVDMLQEDDLKFTSNE